MKTSVSWKLFILELFGSAQILRLSEMFQKVFAVVKEIKTLKFGKDWDKLYVKIYLYIRVSNEL